KAGSIRAYRTVKLVDFDPETKLDFELSLYLPMNNKHIKFNNAGESLGQERIEKFNKKKINSLYIDQADTQKFYDYTAEYLRKIGNDSALSATERQDKLQASVRSLLSGVLSDSGKEGTFETGKTFIADCDKIVKTYIMGAKTGSVYKQILSTLDESNGAYTHTGKVSTLASLFSLGLGIGKPEDLAAAGLLHDMGMANVPIEIQEKPE
ncbi:MAG TPA: HD domain-containing protein, partial [Oligoflexia bacterium]|nr:HD domain-containing protein [Oligoflexia bacterium]